MGYPLDLFLDQAAIHSEFICKICHQVLKHPTMLQECEHIFCESCLIDRMKDLSIKTCPIDSDPIIDERDPTKAFMNMYNGLRLKCEFDGCSHETDLGQLMIHQVFCTHKPPESMEIAEARAAHGDSNPNNESCTCLLKNIKTSVPKHNCENISKQFPARLECEELDKEIELKQVVYQGLEEMMIKSGVLRRKLDMLMSEEEETRTVELVEFKKQVEERNAKLKIEIGEKHVELVELKAKFSAAKERLMFINMDEVFRKYPTLRDKMFVKVEKPDGGDAAEENEEGEG